VRFRSQLPVARHGEQTTGRVTPWIQRDDEDRWCPIAGLPLGREHIRDDERTDRFAVRVGERHDDRPAAKAIERDLLAVLIDQRKCGCFIIHTRERGRDIAI